MGVHTSIRFNDLSYEKQQELTEWIKKILIEEYLLQGEQILKDQSKKWYVMPRSKEEAYCRTYAISSSSWSDLDENSQEFKDYDWTYDLTEYAEEQALLKIVTAFKYIEVDIDINE